MGSSSTSALAVDALNRVWIGTGNGLVMLDSSRRSLTHFGTQDGLPSAAFTDFPGYVTPDGIIIMATQKGYIRFNPLNYVTEKRKLDSYIGSFTVANIETPLISLLMLKLLQKLFLRLMKTLFHSIWWHSIISIPHKHGSPTNSMVLTPIGILPKTPKRFIAICRAVITLFAIKRASM